MVWCTSCDFTYQAPPLFIVKCWNVEKIGGAWGRRYGIPMFTPQDTLCVFCTPMPLTVDTPLQPMLQGHKVEEWLTSYVIWGNYQFKSHDHRPHSLFFTMPPNTHIWSSTCSTSSAHCFCEAFSCGIWSLNWLYYSASWLWGGLTC